MVKRVVVERRRGVYSAFPTFVVHRGYLYLYYRQGHTSDAQVHGLHGVVKRLKVGIDEYLQAHQEPFFEPLSLLGEEKAVFNADNELDAIVAKLEDNLFSLCTRDTVFGSHNRCFVSFGSEPEFYEREEVKVVGVNIHAFYGKPVKTPYGYVFTAYGALEEDKLQRPLLLVTDTQKWELLSHLPTMINGNRLNECSLVRHGGVWTLFIREDDPPFGIWYAESDDLQRWERPQKLFSSAHAPMAFEHQGRLYLAYRWLREEGSYAVALGRPFDAKAPVVVDVYHGSPYDGGYTDLGVVDGKLNIVYYWGNVEAEPEVRSCIIQL